MVVVYFPKEEMEDPILVKNGVLVAVVAQHLIILIILEETVQMELLFLSGRRHD